VSTEDQIQELKFQLGEANKSKPREKEAKESRSSLKPVEVEKIVEKVVEVERSKPPMAEA
jgi:hypothetical protein